MSTTGTQTQTYTVTDIRKVIDHFAADFAMKAEATGLRSRENVDKIVADLKQFAEAKYLDQIKLFLKNSLGATIKATLYKVELSATGWVSQRPGDNLWPNTPGGSLELVASMSQNWWNLTQSQRENFIASNGLNFKWPPGTEVATFAGLTASTGQRYASNGYGLQRQNFN